VPRGSLREKEPDDWEGVACAVFLDRPENMSVLVFSDADTVPSAVVRSCGAGFPPLAPVLHAVVTASEAVFQEAVRLLRSGDSIAALAALQRESGPGTACAGPGGGSVAAADASLGDGGGGCGAVAAGLSALHRVALLGSVRAEVKVPTLGSKLFGIEDPGLREDLATELMTSRSSADRLHVAIALSQGVGIPLVPGSPQLKVLLSEASSSLDPVVMGKPRIVFPRLADQVFATFFPMKVTSWLVGDRLAKCASKGIKFFRDSSWSIHRRFVVLNLVPGRPLDLARVYGEFDGAEEWSHKAAAEFAGLPGPLFAAGSVGSQVDPAHPMFLAVSWDFELHRKLCGRLRRFLRAAAVQLAPPVLSCRIGPPVVRPSALEDKSVEQEVLVDVLCDLFTLEVSTSVACTALLSRQGAFASAVKRVLLGSPVSRESDGRIVMGLVSLGVNVASVMGKRLWQAGSLFEHCSPGVSSRQLVHRAVLALLRPPEVMARLLGEGLGARAGKVSEEVRGGALVHVHQVAGASVADARLLGRGVELMEAALSGGPAELGAVPPGCVRLFHGTSQAAATSILVDGVDFGRLSEHTDFGKALYTSEHFGYALQCANCASVAEGEDAGLPSVIAVDVDMAALVYGWSVLTLGPDGLSVWTGVVSACRRGHLAHVEDEDPGLHADVQAAHVVRGAIAINAERVDTGQLPIPSETTQTAFKKQSAVRRLLTPGAIIAGTGRVAVHAVQVVVARVGRFDLTPDEARRGRTEW
jgi:hypothetical protein